MSYEKRHRKYPIAVEFVREDETTDGKYHVTVDGKAVLETKVLDYALIVFEEQVDEYRIAVGDPDPAKILAEERARRDIRGMRASGIERAERRGRGGGAGGRGGV